MIAVGVRELKTALSRYLREVAAGEVVLVTDRGRVVAELRAPSGTTAPESPVDRALRVLGARLPLVVGEPRDAAAYRASPVRAPPGTARDLLDAERAER
jgi:antitoxin (DNA-binding transcriptional repressor) of toxin-antitoxin stability system